MDNNVHDAIESNNYQELVRLAKNGANISGCAHLAARLNKVECLKVLAQMKVCLKSPNDKGHTPLDYATMEDSLASIEFLKTFISRMNVLAYVELYR